MIHHSADVSTRLGEAHALFAAAASTGKSLHVVRRANHFSVLVDADGKRLGQAWEGSDILVDWIQSRFPG